MSAAGAQTSAGAAQQEEEAADGGAARRTGAQTPAERSGAHRRFPGHVEEGMSAALMPGCLHGNRIS